MQQNNGALFRKLNHCGRALTDIIERFVFIHVILLCDGVNVVNVRNVGRSLLTL